MWLSSEEMKLIQNLLVLKKKDQGLSLDEFGLFEKLKNELQQMEKEKELIILCDEFVQRMEGLAKMNRVKISFEIRYTKDDNFYWINHNLSNEKMPHFLLKEQTNLWTEMFWEVGFRNVVVGYNYEFAVRCLAKQLVARG